MSFDTDGLRVSVRVRTGAPAVSVGGRYPPGVLHVAVSARPVDGAANQAVQAALAAAFGVSRRSVSVVGGLTSRNKVVFLIGDPAALRDRLRALLDT